MMAAKTFEYTSLLQGPVSLYPFVSDIPLKIYEFEAKTPKEARALVQRIHDRLIVDHGFKVAKVAYLRDLKTGRFC